MINVEMIKRLEKIIIESETALGNGELLVNELSKEHSNVMKEDRNEKQQFFENIGIRARMIHEYILRAKLDSWRIREILKDWKWELEEEKKQRKSLRKHTKIRSTRTRRNNPATGI